MILEQWPGISLGNYNKWYPLTGSINCVPNEYSATWNDVNEWFKTFALRAQNDINSYLDFILSKFPFESFKDDLIKTTLVDMVFVMVEHWIYNRTPIEFNIDASLQTNNGTFSSNSIPTINVWDLAPSRMKILANLTQLKQIINSYNDDEIDPDLIDLKTFYTKTEIKTLLKEQKDFFLEKQIKLYDEVMISDNLEKGSYRGPVTNLIVKGFVATDYDNKTETAVLDFPKEIGTLPQNVLVPAPQEQDFTHAATADFSAKQQKRINENNNKIDENVNEIKDLNTNFLLLKNRLNDYINRWKIVGENINDFTYTIHDNFPASKQYKVMWGLTSGYGLMDNNIIIKETTLWLNTGVIKEKNKYIIDYFKTENNNLVSLTVELFPNSDPTKLDGYAQISVLLESQEVYKPYIQFIKTNDFN